MKLTRRTKIITAVAVGFVAILGVTAGIVIWQNGKDVEGSGNVKDVEFENGFANAAISCDAPGCAEIGKSMLLRNGSVIDAAIPTLLCMGIIHSHSLGVGGGFFATLYNATTKSASVLNAREMAPAGAFEDMYEGNSSLSQRGPLAVAVPGEMKGYWELYKRGGRLPWADLLQPIIDLCRNGFEVTDSSAAALQSSRTAILREPTMREIFVNPATGDVWKAGDIMYRPKLADTLEIIAHSPIGGDELYSGELGTMLVDDLEEMGGIITKEDLLNYTVVWEEPITLTLHGNYTVYTVPPPGSGVLMGYIMRIVNDFLPDTESMTTKFQRIVEAMKHTYAKRTMLGDPWDSNVTEIVKELIEEMTSMEYAISIREMIDDQSTNNTYEYYGAEYYQPDDHGTAHMSIVGANGDAIAITSTINLHYGAQIRSRRTGIIYNDEMDDFSSPNITNAFGVPPSVNNFIKPGKRPLSSMCPSVFIDGEGKVRLVIGGAGGTKITTQSAIVAIRNLWFGQSIEDSVAAPRIHHQLYPMEIDYESNFDARIIQDLQTFGHNATGHTSTSAVIGAVARASDGLLYGSLDWRKNCSVAGY